MSAELDNLIRWALAAPCPNSRQIGTHAVGRVLVALALHGNARWEAWPSTQTLADCIDALSRRDVRNALELLEEAGLIAKTGRRKGRCTVWRLAVDDMAGDVAGEVAGEVAGNVAGYPASKGGEGNPPPARLDSRRAELLTVLGKAGVEPADVEAVIETAAHHPDTHTSPIGRLLASETHRSECIATVRAEASERRRREEARAPKCDECGKTIATCERIGMSLKEDMRCEGITMRAAAETEVAS